MGLWISLLLALFGFSAPQPAADTREPVAAESANASATMALGPARPAAPLPLPEISGASDPNRPLVVIDPGHGGRDPGAISSFEGVSEEDVTLAISRAIRDALAESGRVRVALTRDSDRYLGLEQRYEIARRLRADLFISVHADAAPHNDQAHGATIYTLSEVASDREAALLAERENGAARIGGADFSRDEAVNRILIDLAQRESMATSADFAQLLHREAAPYFDFRPDYHRFAALIVLKAPDMPSILFESGYLTNEEEAAWLRTAKGREQIAAGMRDAIETHFAAQSLRR